MFACEQDPVRFWIVLRFKTKGAVAAVATVAAVTVSAAPAASASPAEPAVPSNFVDAFVQSFHDPLRSPAGANDWDCTSVRNPVVLIHGTWENA